MSETPAHTTPAITRPSETFIDAANTPETRGIEVISETDRHGKARDLFFVWSAPHMSILGITTGASLTFILGLEIWQGLLVLLVSGILQFLPGLVAISGPSSGTSGSVVQRAIYGVRGNRIVIAFYGWFISGVFLALSWVGASFMGAELLIRWGFADRTLALILVAVVTAAITVLVAVYGHALILKAYTGISIGLAIVFTLVIGFLWPHLDWGYQQAEPLTGLPLWSSITIGFAILASGPLSFTNSADVARYLPKDTPASHIIGATGLGMLFPGILINAIGVVLGATMRGMATDEGIQTALLGFLPVWLVPLFVLGVLANTIALNGMTTYTASMALQSIGVPIRRIPSAVLIGVLGVAFTIVLVMSSTLIEAVNLLLQFLLVISVPTMAVYATDIILRRNRYNGYELFDESRSSAFWYSGGFSIPGMVSVIAGGVATALFLSTTLWTGPLAVALGYLDLSVPIGSAVSVLAYVVLAGPVIRART